MAATKEEYVALDNRYSWPSSLEIHAPFFQKEAGHLFPEISKAWVHRKGNKVPTALEVWQVICEDVLTPETPFSQHQALHECNFCDWDKRKLGPAPVWVPSDDEARKARSVRLILELQEHFAAGKAETKAERWERRRRMVGANSNARDLGAAFAQLQRFSVEDQDTFWFAALRELGIHFRQSPNRLYYPRPGPQAGQEQWFPGALMNIVDSCFTNQQVGDRDSQDALVWAREGKGDVISDNGKLHSWTYGELFLRSSRIANCLKSVGIGRNARVGICMPMTAESVAIYLAVVMSGGAIIGIADSFSKLEIQTRLRVAKADAVITQDALFRGNKYIPLYERVARAGDDYRQETGKAVQIICLPADLPSGFTPEESGEKDTAPSLYPLRCKIRPVDLPYTSLLAMSSSTDFDPCACHPQDVTNILFSSGTTGEPKAIPWDHVAPIKAGADAMLHHDARSGDVVCWPTNLGWMMGPWLIYAGLLNGACVAIFEGSPLGNAFCDFVEKAGVTMLGTVPSIVKGWRAKGATEGKDWSNVRRFTSSGEASNPEEYHWLSSRVKGYAPVIEYIGGTEIAGAYMSGSLLQPQAASHFSVAAFGTNLRLLDSSMKVIEPASMHDQIYNKAGGFCEGEVAIIPPMLGSSYKLLNRDHDEVYFAEMPLTSEGIRTRKHGDMLAYYPGGYSQAKGRTDDTMNLGGIKTSSLEIENVCNASIGSSGLQLKEVAAVAVAPQGGGPEQLWICVSVSGNVEDFRQKLEGECQSLFQKAISKNLNPLFKVHRVVFLQDLPRTASNKMMRKALQAQCQAQSNQPKAKL
jgi:acyl-coenzyme A synthetase/AMP-(fatty) acid ligase